MDEKPSKDRWWKFITGSAGRLGMGLIGATIAVAVAPGSWGWTLRLIAGWSAGAAIYLAVAWWVMMRASPEETRKRCRRDDPYRGTIDTLLLFASGASVGAVCLALRESSSGGGPEKVVSVGIPILGAVLAWLLVHTLYALHYARLFYKNDEDPDGPPVGGIDMHQDDDAPPDYRDFLYIAVAVACTFGVTDTELKSKVLRRTVTQHALLSFAFATIVLALAVNVLLPISCRRAVSLGRMHGPLRSHPMVLAMMQRPEWFISGAEGVAMAIEGIGILIVAGECRGAGRGSSDSHVLELVARTGNRRSLALVAERPACTASDLANRHSNSACIELGSALLK